MTENSQSMNSGFSSDAILALEHRIAQLENQLHTNEKIIEEQKQTLLDLSNKIPDTSLLSPQFTTRALTIWGHYFVGQVILATPFILPAIVASLISK